MARRREVRAPDEFDDRWLEYTPMNKPIEDTRIIAIKTPLEKHFNNGLTREQAKRECKNGVPKEDDFSQILSDFLNDPAHDSEIVAVHCTHGINRSGYLVCRYLIDHCGVDVETAIKRFNEARGHNIERPNYLKHLRSGCSATTPSYQSHRSPYHYHSAGRDPYRHDSSPYHHDSMDRDPVSTYTSYSRQSQKGSKKIKKKTSYG